MADRKHYLIQDDDGVLTVFRCRTDDNAHWGLFGTVPPDELPPALAIGLKVVELADGQELGEMFVGVRHAGGGRAAEFIQMPLLPPKPVEKVGVEYLRTLPWGSQRCNNQTGYGGVFTVMYDGLHWHHDGGIWKWDGTQTYEHQSWHNVPWVLCASPETCPEWAPEQPNKGKE